MISELGLFSLILALIFALTQAAVPLAGAQLRQPLLLSYARPMAVAQFIFVGLSYACLTYAFISNDFSVQYVAQNSNNELPLIYRICAVWGAHEGSLLLWVLILNGWTLALTWFSRRLPTVTTARVIAVLGLISTGFLLFLLITSNPFQRYLPEFPANGQDLNPLLQDPGLIIHPPMLYMGYVGFSIAFAFAIAALWEGRLDQTWVRWMRPWTLVAWSFLTFGITLGSWWAYRELGWGGWWFWDPVENASFLPWLVGTALIHSLAVTDKRDAFKGWTVFLAICAFALSLLGTFLVRSGVLVSVHAFATDPSRGIFMLLFLFTVIAASLLLYALRAARLQSTGQFYWLSRETLLLSNNILLVVAMVTVLLGTLYPLAMDALGLAKLSVGPPYFNTVIVPLLIPLLFLMGVGPLCYWRQMPAKVLLQRLYYILAASLTLSVILPLSIAGMVTARVALGLMLALWIIVATGKYLLDIRKLRGGFVKLTASQYGMVLAHLGVALCVIGITLTTAYQMERDVQMQPGDKVTVGPYHFKFVNIEDSQGANYRATAGRFEVSRQGKLITLLVPEKRIYNAQRAVMTETAIDAGLFRDLYVALGNPIGEQSWGVRVYYKPFVRWIWLGGLFMLIGGAAAAIDKRYRTRRETV